MADAVRPSADRFRAVYEDSFRVWSSLYLDAIENPVLPPHDAGACLKYTGVQAHFADADAVPHQLNGRKTVHVALQDSRAEEMRWWAAILAPGQGWQARMTCEQDTAFLSPWSVIVKARLFLLWSCNTAGIATILASVFYEPSIECNEATPWLQGARSVINALVGDNQLVLGRMMMDRLPNVAFIWLGATILGLQKKIANPAVHYGQMWIDLDAAEWSGTLQSFIQLPISIPLAAADETDETMQTALAMDFGIGAWCGIRRTGASMDCDRESVSGDATRNIFGWLRFAGYAPREEEMWKHEWFTEFDDEDGDGREQGKADTGTAHGTGVDTAIVDVNCWISQLESLGPQKCHRTP
ncbi:hypothetical protein B0T19DRAFT_488527 [Cercophora scortea]|uniref:Uncharacterized protein n=1 Tax=Cercophora scortea TaxID=314031 RepID=A0AAE0M2S7_9PEZI|nr:hypothetical protein B0T19DRAFT_488527 [Cercophora scortea]